jgi:hypothetical protein
MSLKKYGQYIDRHDAVVRFNAQALKKVGVIVRVVRCVCSVPACVRCSRTVRIAAS